MDELPVGGRSVRLADEVGGSRVRGDCGEGDDEVAELQIRLEAAAGSDPEQPLQPSWMSSSITIAGRGTAHSGRLDRNRPPVVRAGETEHPALGVLLLDALHERLGDVFGAQRVAGQEARLGVVAWLGTDVDGHGRNLNESGGEIIDRWRGSSDRPSSSHPRLLRRGSGRARLPRGRRPSGSRPVRRPSRTRIGSRRSATSGRTSSPPGAGRRDSPRSADSEPRMIVGEEEAVSELWEALRKRLPTPLDDRPGQPVYVLDEPPAAGESGLRAGDARRPGRARLAPPRMRTSRRSASTPTSATRRSSSGARARRSSRGGAGSGARTGTSSSRPRRRPGRRRSSSSSRSGSSQSYAATATEGGRSPISAACSSSERRPSASSCDRRTSRRSASTSRSACAGRSRTARSSSTSRTDASSSSRV